jgi:hypothetical protein
MSIHTVDGTLEETDAMEVLRLVPLACGTGAHELGDQHAGIGHVEVNTKTLQSLGDALMAHAVCRIERLL